jgi:hypothetical protein
MKSLSRKRQVLAAFYLNEGDYMKAFPWTGAGTDGMDLRDYFAAAALQGMLSENGGGALCNPDLATWAFTIADAMMKAREQ